MRRTLLFLLDIALLYAGLLAMLGIRYHGDLAVHFKLHLVPFSMIFAVWLLVFYIAGLYETRNFRNGPQFYSLLAQAVSISSAISLAFFYLLPVFGITPKTNLFIFIVLFSALDAFVRWLFNRALEASFRKRTLIVSAEASAQEMIALVKNHPQLGYELTAVIAPDQTAELERIVSEGKLDVIVIGPDAYRVPAIIETFYHALRKKIAFYSLSSFFERLTGRVPLGAINQIWFLDNFTESTKRPYESAKRVLDAFFGFIFGLISLIFYPFIILAIELNSPGPIFYTQVRIGQMGKPFKIVKFRTMIPNAEAGTGAIWATDHDTRVTAVGRFLRRSRLDELPQLWNIVRGDMSLVGPRAERPEFHDELRSQIPFYEERYLIKPGLSGWAQINFRYGSSVEDAAEKLQYDLYYIKNRSFALDLGIVLKTIRIALQQAGK
ncbi:MAG TPA: sugar transferase [Candidatus Paceibacterota bacterium]|nr:sugar transferase [Candidatus Paceibacterota bacterium]